MTTKHMKASIILTGLIILLVGIGYLGVQYFSDTKVDYTAINEIKSSMLSPGVFYRGESTVCVESVDDLGFVRKSSSINLYYGKIVVNIPYKALDNSEFMKALSDIGITVYTRQNDEGDTEYRLTYWGEPIEEWSRVG